MDTYQKPGSLLVHPVAGALTSLETVMNPNKIMIVEDEVVLSTDLRRKLEKMDFQVAAIVRYGEKVLEAARDVKPDLVLMDIHLKGDMDGIQAAQQLQERLPLLPVVFLTAYADDATLERAKVTGPYSYLKKPVRLEDLRISIEMALYKGQMEQKLKESELRFRTVADFTYDLETWLSPTGDLLYMSPSCERITGYRREEFMADPELLYRIIQPEEGEDIRAEFEKHLQAREGNLHLEFSIVRSDEEERWIEHICQPVYSPDGQYLGRRASNRDITARKAAETEKAKLIVALQAALENIETLSGLLPICANCKKIRDDQGYWNQIESYIRKHSKADFSHGICPECLDKLYGDQDWYHEQKKE